MDIIKVGELLRPGVTSYTDGTTIFDYTESGPILFLYVSRPTDGDGYSRGFSFCP